MKLHLFEFWTSGNREVDILSLTRTTDVNINNFALFSLPHAFIYSFLHFCPILQIYNPTLELTGNVIGNGEFIISNRLNNPNRPDSDSPNGPMLLTLHSLSKVYGCGDYDNNYPPLQHCLHQVDITCRLWSLATRHLTHISPGLLIQSHYRGLAIFSPG